MTIAEWCVFGTLMLYLLTIASVKWAGHRHFDNARPRDPAFYEDAIRARALGAHQNGIEAFPFFAVAVLLAEFRLAPQHLIDELAVLFLIVRIAYVLTYLGNRPTLRSILWSIGFAINIAIFFLPAIKAYLPTNAANECLQRCRAYPVRAPRWRLSPWEKGRWVVPTGP